LKSEELRDFEKESPSISSHIEKLYIGATSLYFLRPTQQYSPNNVTMISLKNYHLNFGKLLKEFSKK